MINLFYFCICLLIVTIRSNFVEIEDYSNDSPFTQPKIEISRLKVGSDILLKCTIDRHLKRQDVAWEFKPCETNYRGVHCNTYNVYNLDDNTWMKLDYNRGKKRLEIRDSTDIHNGLYRCIHNDSIKKIYMVEIVDPAKYEGPSPEVVSLLPTNSTVLPNAHFVIQCRVTSVIPPTILWFRECNGFRCDIRENGQCFCHINTTNTVYSNGDIYYSKMNVYNARGIDGGLYACLAVSLYGKDYKNVTIKVLGFDDEFVDKSYSFLFLIPLALILVPISVWLCYFRKKNKNEMVNQEKHLIRPVVNFDIVLQRDNII